MMKKWIIILILSIIVSNNIHTTTNKMIKRHFFDLCFSGGFSFRFTEYINEDHEPDLKEVETGIGGLFGISIGYQYAFNDYFAFGGGIYIIPGLMDLREKSYYNDTGEEYYDARVISPMNGGMGGTLLFMFGSLDKYKAAFLLDIGGGMLFIIKLGFYYKGIVFKLGYHVPWLLYSEEVWPPGTYITYNIIFDIGYKFNWGKKKK